MIQSFEKINKVIGKLNLPGDKSVSHRAVMFASLARGKSIIHGYLNSADVNTTIRCFKYLGVEIRKEEKFLIVEGAGFKGLRKSYEQLDAGNSGTTARLISGILAAQSFKSTLMGDDSLSKRPMKRVIDPLTEMGAFIESDNNTLPVTIKPAELHAIDYHLPVASAQVKSAVLLAGLHLEDTTTVTETLSSRDHTERMLGLNINQTEERKVISVSKENYPERKEYVVPSDISTAAFFMVLASLLDGSELLLRNVSLNLTRTGVLKTLTDMGADIEIDNESEYSNEPIGDILIKSSGLKNIEITPSIIPNIIDEIPVLSVAGLFAEGAFEIRNAEELRHKETDRISALCNNYKLLGLDVEEYEDGFAISGDIKYEGVTFESYGDHRIAMAFAVLSSLLEKGGKVNGFECIDVSNPDFLKQLEQITR